MPDITFVVPTYNCAKHLPKCLDSLIRQRLPGRIVVVDDASTDDTLTVLGAYKDKVNMLGHRERKGANAARNTGMNWMEQTFGIGMESFVCFCDADAVYYPDYSEKLYAGLADNIGAFAYCYWHNEKPEGGVNDMRIPPWDTELLWWDQLTIPMPSMIRCLMLPHDGLDETSQYRDDWKLWLWMAERGSRGVCVPEFLFMHRFRHEGKTITYSRNVPQVWRERSHVRRKFASLSRLPSPVVCLMYGAGDGSGNPQHCIEHLEEFSGLPLIVYHVVPDASDNNHAIQTTLPYRTIRESEVPHGLPKDVYLVLIRDDCFPAPECIERMIWWLRMFPTLDAVGPLLLDDSHQSLLELSKNGHATEHMKRAAERMPDFYGAAMALHTGRQLIEMPVSPVCAAAHAKAADRISWNQDRIWLEGEMAAAQDALCINGVNAKLSSWL